MAAARDSKGRFVKMGLGAELTFDDSRATANMRRAHGVLGALHNQFMQTGAGVGRLSGALKAGASATKPLAAGIMMGANIAAEFERQLSNVNSVLMTSPENMEKLEKKAKELGASTKFTAKEAAEGMEQLASAGFTTDQILSGIGGTLALAAAGALDLGAASEITGNVINGMGLEAKDAAHVADVLAKVAADSATDVRAVGVAFKYSAAQARSMGISLEENAFMLGAMADAGMKGSSGGTALQNMLSKIVKPTEAGTKLFKQMNLQMDEVGADGKKRFRPILDIVNDVNKELAKIDVTERGAIQEAVFGKIGQKGFSALAARGERDTKMTDEERKSRSVAAFGQGAVDGAAKKMADLRLVGVLGALEQLKSAGEGVVLEIFNKKLTAPIEAGLKQITEGVSGVVQVMQGLAEGKSLEDLEMKFGPVITGIAVGLRDAVIAVGAAIEWIKTQIQEFFADSKTSNMESIRQWVKYAAIFAVVAAAVLPVIAVLGGIAFVVTAVIIPAVTGLAAIMAAAFWPVTLIGLALIGVYYSLARENESLGQTVSRVWGDISMWVNEAWENSLKPLWEGLKYGAEVVWPTIKHNAVGAVMAIYGVVEQLFGLFRDFFPETEGGWTSLGTTIATVFGETIGWVLDVVRDRLEAISWFIGKVRESFKMIADGEILAGFVKLGSALLESVLEPVREILKSAIMIADSVYVPIPDAVRGFAFGGIGLEKAKERLNSDDDDPSQEMRFAATSYAPEVKIGNAAADLAAAKNEGSAATLEKAIQSGMEAAEKNRKGCETTINTNTILDGKKVARNQARIKNEMDERAGFKAQPYQRRMMIEQGTKPG